MILAIYLTEDTFKEKGEYRMYVMERLKTQMDYDGDLVRMHGIFKNLRGIDINKDSKLVNLKRIRKEYIKLLK